MKILHERIDALLKVSRLSVNEVAARTGVSPEYIWRLRHGKSPQVSAGVLVDLADALGVSVYYFFGVDRDDLGMPVPEPEVAPLVAALNDMPEGRRRRAVELLLGIVAFSVEPAAEPALTPEAQQLVRLLDALAPESRRAWLAKYLYSRVYQPGDPLFVSDRGGGRLTVSGLGQICKRLGRATGIHVSPHSLRRTCATFCHRSGWRLTEIQKLLGHSDTSVLRRYLDLDSGDVAAAHHAAPPSAALIGGKKTR